MFTRRRFVLTPMLASLLAASGLALMAGPLGAAERPSVNEILNALKPGAKTRALSPSRTQPSAEDQRFIDSLRAVKTRSLSSGERQKVAEIAKEKPSIDLEIYFNYNSAQITSKAVPDLMNLGRALSSAELKGGTFLVGGHTDAKGGEVYNQRLSERRAEEVKRFLMQKFGLASEGLVTAGYGKEQLKDVGQSFGGRESPGADHQPGGQATGRTPVDGARPGSAVDRRGRI